MHGSLSEVVGVYRSCKTILQTSDCMHDLLGCGNTVACKVLHECKRMQLGSRSCAIMQALVLGR